MQWLFPSVVSTFFATLLFASTYFYLYLSEHEKCFGVWAISWSVYSLRYVCVLIMLHFGQNQLLQIAVQLFPLIGAFLLMYGTGIWLQKRFSKYWLIVSAGISIWIIISIFLQFGFLLSTLPSFLFMGAIYIWTGVVFIRGHQHESVGKHITGWAFILWGIHKMDYPFLRPVAWFAPVGFLLAAIFTVIASIGLILIYFEIKKYELQKSEARWRSLTENSPDHILTLDTELKIQFANFASPGLTVKDLIGTTLYSYVEGEQKQHEVKKTLESVILTGVQKSYDTRYSLPDGETIYYESRVTPRFIKDSKDIIGLTVNSRDITERKQAEEKLQASLKEKETLLHEIHHRVKNNMQVISSLLDLQSTSIEDKQIKEVLKESKSRVHTMAAVHETLHDSDRLSDIDLKSYISKIIPAIFDTYSISPGRITLNNKVEEVPISINQASPLGLIINELISNSLKYAFPDDRKGEISVTMKKENSELELRVMDDGIGMPEGLDWRNTNSLGLKLVRSLAEDQLGGSINMESNNGTKFIIKFNIDKA